MIRELLFLDEPTNGLDPGGRDDMLGLIERTGTIFGISVIMSSHLLGEIESVCDALVVIDEGTLVQSGAVSSFTGLVAVVEVEVDREPELLARRLGELGLAASPEWTHRRRRATGRDSRRRPRGQPTGRRDGGRARTASRSRRTPAPGVERHLQVDGRGGTVTEHGGGSHGEIYDLGYRNYDGPRRGRAYAVRSLCALSIRNTFGLGRGALPKVLAFGLAVLALVPAIVQLITAALVGPSDFSVLKPQDYFGLIQIVLVLFVAAMASDLVGNDRRSNTLVLYFSRPIKRDDYVLAKIFSLAIALLALTLLPQLLGFAGNWLGARDTTAWFTDNASDLAWIVVSSLLVSAMLAAIGVAIATFASRRAFAMIR